MIIMCLYIILCHAYDDLEDTQNDKNDLLTRETVISHPYPLNEQERTQNLGENVVLPDASKYQGNKKPRSAKEKSVLKEYKKNNLDDSLHSDVDFVTDNHIDGSNYRSNLENHQITPPIVGILDILGKGYNSETPELILKVNSGEAKTSLTPSTFYNEISLTDMKTNKKDGLESINQKLVDNDKIYNVIKKFWRTLDKNNNFTETIKRIRKENRLPGYFNLFDDYYQAVLNKIKNVENTNQFLPFIDKLADDTFLFIYKKSIRDDASMKVNLQETEKIWSDVKQVIDNDRKDIMHNSDIKLSERIKLIDNDNINEDVKLIDNDNINEDVKLIDNDNINEDVKLIDNDNRNDDNVNFDKINKHDDYVNFDEIADITPVYDIDFNEYYRKHHPIYRNDGFDPETIGPNPGIIPYGGGHSSGLGLGGLLGLGIGAIGLASSSGFLGTALGGLGGLGAGTSALSGISSMANGLKNLNSGMNQFPKLGPNLDKIGKADGILKRPDQIISRKTKTNSTPRTMTTRRPQNEKENKKDKKKNSDEYQENKDAKKNDNLSKDDKKENDKKNDNLSKDDKKEIAQQNKNTGKDNKENDKKNDNMTKDKKENDKKNDNLSKDDKEIEQQNKNTGKNGKELNKKNKNISKDKKEIDKKDIKKLESTVFTKIFNLMVKLFVVTLTGIVFSFASYCCWQRKRIHNIKEIDTEKGKELQQSNLKK